MAKTFRIPKDLVDQMEMIAQKSTEAMPQDPAASSPESQVPPFEPEEQFTEPMSEVPAVPIDIAPPMESATSEPAIPPARPVASVPTEVVEVAPPVVPTPKSRKPRNELSDSDLEDWTARVAALQQEREQARRVVAERQAKKKEQAAAWRTLRRLVEEASRPQEAEIDPVAADALAQRVHQAPKKIRDVIAAVLTAHGC